MRMTSTVASLALLLAGTLAAGCTTTDDTVRLAFTVKDDDLGSPKDPNHLATALANATGRDVRIFQVDNTEAALEAVRAGQADAAIVDGTAAWVAWKVLGLEAIAAQKESDGRTHYVATAYVLQDSPYRSMADLRGADSCHTGLMKSAGMFMPLGWLVKEGLAPVVGNRDDVASIQPTVEAYFGTATIPASDNAPYGNYQGAMECLSKGVGDVAFVKDTTPATFCAPDAKGGPRDWCLPMDKYRKLQEFGRVPSHVVMVSPGSAVKGVLASALEQVGTSEPAVLKSVLNTGGFVGVTTQEHLGEWSDVIAHVPGMSSYAQGQIKG